MNNFKVKTWREFDLTILKIKQIHYKRIEVFTIKFNPKSIATSNSNLLIWPRARFESMDSFSSQIYTNISKHPWLWLWDSTQRFQITISNDLDATTMFYQCLIIDLTLVNSCIVRRYKTSNISQRVTHKSSKSLQNVAKVFLLYVEKLEWNPKRFHGLGLGLKSAKFLFLRFSINRA